MKYEYWFAGIRNIPDRTKIKLKEKAGTAEAIYYIEETALRKMQLLKEQEIWKLLEAKKKYPGVTNMDNVNDIIRNLKKRKEQEH